MTSFQLVNHQIKHLFGGVQAERNSSIQNLQAEQNRIAKSMERVQINHHKIYEAVRTIKNCIGDLNDNYLSISKQNKHSGGLVSLNYNLFSQFLQNFEEESLMLSRKMKKKIQSYIPNLRTIKQRYVEKAQTLQHYRTKLVLLKKNVQKQSLANIKKQQHERYERNKDKLRNAQKQYDSMLIKTIKSYIQFNNDGLKDIYNDYLLVLANFTNNAMTASHTVTQHLTHNVLSKELLEQHLKQKAQSKLAKRFIEAAHQMGSVEPNKFIDNLIEQRFMRDYLLALIQKEFLRMDHREKIKEYFLRKQGQQQTDSTKTFENFSNQYGNQTNNITFANEVKQQEIAQGCEDLLQISHTASGRQIDQPDIGPPKQIVQSQSLEVQSQSLEEEISSPSKQKPQDLIIEDDWAEENKQRTERIKKNLQKFNILCETNKTMKKPVAVIVNESIHKQSLIVINDSAKNKQEVLKQDQFFHYKQPESIVSEEIVHKNTKEAQVLVSKVQNESVFDFFDSKAVKPIQQQSNSANKTQFAAFNENKHKHLQPKTVTFQAFDFFGSGAQKQQNSIGKAQQKSTTDAKSNLLDLM